MPFSKNIKKYSTWLKRALLNAWHNLLRNKLLSIATIVIISLMFFVFNLVLALSYAAESVIANVGEKLDISIEIQPTVEDYNIQIFAENLRKRPEVKEVVYVSKAEALDRFGSKYPNIISFLDHHQLTNPLPNVIRIVNYDVADNNVIISYLQEPQFSQIVNQEKLSQDIDQKTRNEKILDITRFIQRIGTWLILIFAFVGILIIFNSININIHTHKHEIHIMKLVGAKHSFIRAGFIFEGIVFAVSALLVSIGFSRFVLAYLTRNLVAIISNENLLAGLNSILWHFEERFWITLSWQMLAAVVAGILSSYLAIELYLRKKHYFNY
ncbi:permease-like cell division protein FtsX [Patescibacteria group bacterium]|nr:permease-like cell division protein FtsX [Patescibacteria group bacterium]